MKNILKFLLVLFVTLQSCEETQAPIFDGSQTLVYFDSPTSSLDVVIDDVGSVNVIVGSSTLASSDRSFDVVLVDTDSNASNFTLPTSVVIPANEYFGTITVSGFDFDLTTVPELITIALSGSVAATTITDAEHTITIKQVCPVPSDYLVGDYTIFDNTPNTPNFGQGNTVTLSIPNDADGNPIETQRVFNDTFLPTTGVATDVQVVLDLVCNTIDIQEVDINVTCTQNAPYLVGPAGVPNQGSYDVSMNSPGDVVTVNYTEDTAADCGPTAIQNFTLTKL